MEIELIEIKFISTDGITMFFKDYTNIVELSKRLNFNINDWAGNKRVFKDIRDIDFNEWNG